MDNATQLEIKVLLNKLLLGLFKVGYMSVEWYYTKDSASYKVALGLVKLNQLKHQMPRGFKLTLAYTLLIKYFYRQP